ncbi:MAG: PSP1 domain-containing protein [Christensenellales bacterium]|jgi:cell fate regulator YaaT (PSP1 superfamily)
MAWVISIRFRRSKKTYYFDPAGLEYTIGNSVVVETAKGLEYGDVVSLPREVPDSELVAPLKPVLRLALPADEARVEDNSKREVEAMGIAAECIAARSLDMKLVDVEYTFDGKKIVFYFTADGRVDFRELVRDLAARFHTRIELRQIGVRDETKMLGGLGPCGRAVCCATFLSDFIPVSIRMAKEQNISLNPTKISGLCGRLMCCLQYEQAFYQEERSKSPKPGTDVLTPDGVGEIMEHYIVRRKFRVRVLLSDLSYDMREYPVDQVEVITAERRAEEIRKLEKQLGKTQQQVALEEEERADRARETRESQARSRANRPRPSNENKARSIDDLQIFRGNPDNGPPELP